MELSHVVFNKLYFYTATIDEQSSQPLKEERVWQSTRLSLLKCEGNPAKDIYWYMLGVILTHMYVIVFSFIV